MGRLFILILALPWWAFFPLAGGVVWFGEYVYDKALETEAEKASALAAGLPEAVDLADFDIETDRHAAREVNVRGWIDTDLNYELVEHTNGVPTKTRHMMMMFGANDAKGSPVVRAAIVMNEKQKDMLLDRIDQWIVDFNDQGFIFEINGFAKTTSTLGNLAYDAIEEQGLRRNGPDFVFIEPFLDGRDAALAPRGAPQKVQMTVWLVALGVALFGVAKRLLLGRRAQPQAPREAAKDDAPPVAPSVPLASNITPDTPLGRLAARRAAPEEEPNPWAPEPFEAQDTIADARHAADPSETAAVLADLSDRTPPAQTLSNVVFFARLALAMLFVAALFYEPPLALALLAIVVPVFVLIKLIGTGVSILSRRREAELV